MHANTASWMVGFLIFEWCILSAESKCQQRTMPYKLLLLSTLSPTLHYWPLPHDYVFNMVMVIRLLCVPKLRTFLLYSIKITGINKNPTGLDRLCVVSDFLLLCVIHGDGEKCFLFGERCAPQRPFQRKKTRRWWRRQQAPFQKGLPPASSVSGGVFWRFPPALISPHCNRNIRLNSVLWPLTASTNKLN